MTLRCLKTEHLSKYNKIKYVANCVCKVPLYYYLHLILFIMCIWVIDNALNVYIKND